MTYQRDNIAILTMIEELVRANFAGDLFDEMLKLISIIIENSGRNEKLEALKISELNKILLRAINRFPGLIRGRSILLNQDHISSIFSSIDYGNFVFVSDFVDTYFESLISRLDKADKGQFFTPRHVVELCVKMSGIRSTDEIVDPSCGAGGFLTHSASLLNSRDTKKEFKLTGIDIDERVIRLARLNMFMNELEDFELTIANTLDRDKSMDSYAHKFDVLFANPPFAGEIKSKRMLDSYSISHKDMEERDILFIERCTEMIKVDGKIIIILPYSVFGSKNLKYVRQWMFKNLQILGIISLPRETFMPYTHQKANILLARKKTDSDSTSDSIFMAISKLSGKTSNGEWIFKDETSRQQNLTLWDLVDHDFESIVTSFENFLIEEKIKW